MLEPMIKRVLSGDSHVAVRESQLDLCLSIA